MIKDTVIILIANLFYQFGRNVMEFAEKTKILEVERLLKLKIDGKYEINHQKFDARELILGQGSSHKKEAGQLD